MPKPQVQGPPVPGWTVNPESLGLSRDRLRGTRSWGTQDSLPVLCLEILWFYPSMILWNRVSELGGLEQLALPLITELGRLVKVTWQSATECWTGKQDPEVWLQLCQCLTVNIWASGLPEPELPVAQELCVPPRRTSGSMGGSAMLGPRDDCLLWIPQMTRELTTPLPDLNV